MNRLSCLLARMRDGSEGENIQIVPKTKKYTFGMPNLRFLNNGEIKTNHKGRNMKDLVETLWFLDLPRLGEIFQLSFRQFEVFRECFLLKDKRSMSEFLSTLIVCESDFTPNFASDNKLVFYMEYFYIFTSW